MIMAATLCVVFALLASVHTCGKCIILTLHIVAVFEFPASLDLLNVNLTGPKTQLLS